MMDFIRNRLFRSFADLGATIFLGTAIPIIYWFEMFVVLPDIEFLARSPALYYGHLALGTFILYQIVGNWVFVMATDTSIRKVMMRLPAKEDIDLHSRDKWRFCATCESMQPPRSWHCKVCNVCILKRDHHCLFTGCCIGHKNQRYFMVLVLYLCIATTYATMYNNYFIWIRHGRDFKTWTSVLKMVFPLAWLFVDWSKQQVYFFAYAIGAIGSLFTGALLVYHGRNVVRGELAHEANSKKDQKVDYNLGWRRNIELVLGRNWIQTLINPFAVSELPHDGIDWTRTGSDKAS